MELRVLQKLQRDTGFNADFIEKAYHITRILFGISENGKLSKKPRAQRWNRLEFRQVAQFVRQDYAVNAITVKRKVADFYENIFKLDSNDRKFLKRIEDGIVELDVLFDRIRYNKKAQKHPSLCHALKRGQRSSK